MKQYLQLVRDILDNGSWQENRTGIRALSIPGAMMKFDLKEGFPAVTTKKLAFKTAIGELVGFLRGYTNAAQFRALGCKVWDQNANENAQWRASPYRREDDDLGPIYGAQWRKWPAYKLIDLDERTAAGQVKDAFARGYVQVGTVEEANLAGDKVRKAVLYKAIDQVRQCLNTIISDPGSRRILFHGWNCAQLEEMALPPCHLLYQFMVDTSRRELSLSLYIRSNDVALGTPFNIAEGAALLHLVGRLTGYTPRWFTYFVGDVHVYESHVDMLREQLKREPYAAPRLVLSPRIPDYAATGNYEPEWLEKVEPSDFWLDAYEHHPALTAPMAV